MNQDIRPGGDVPSPCNNVCRMNPDTGECEGCYRTLERRTGVAEGPAVAGNHDVHAQPVDGFERRARLGERGVAAE